MIEYYIFLSTCIGLTLSLIGLWLWLEDTGQAREGGKLSTVTFVPPAGPPDPAILRPAHLPFDLAPA